MTAIEFSYLVRKIPPSKHEIFAAIARRPGQKRKIVIVVIYVPPWYNAKQNRSLYRHTNDVLLVLRNKYDSPYVVVGGDFNRRSLAEATRDFPIRTGPTRLDSVLDVMACNFGCSVVDCGTVDPIHNFLGSESDHLTVHALSLIHI